MYQRYTATNANINSGPYRAEQRPVAIPCDGVGGHDCPNAAKRHVAWTVSQEAARLVGFQTFGPVDLSMNLCPACHAEWLRWQEGATK
jgi:hypothetical protein